MELSRRGFFKTMSATGEFKWEESPKPVYAWYSGYVKRIFKGDEIDMDAPVINLTEPVGSIKDPNAKISPFKIMKGVQCHESLKGERTCDRCHQDNRDVDFKEIAHKGTDFSYMAKKGRNVSHLIGTTDYIDFKGLGYKGDPIIYGGRFKKLPMGYKNRQ